MREIWDSDGQLAYFAVWAFQEGRVNFLLDAAASTSAFRDDEWWRNFRRLGRRYRSDPFYSGTNALHLGHSDFGFNTDVDVFDKRVGWLGTYRQSRVTGRWFAGTHSLHMVGQ